MRTEGECGSVARNWRARLANLEAQRAALLERYTPSHPSVVAIDAQTQPTGRELAKDLIFAVAIAQDELKFRVQKAKLAEKRAALNRLTREAEIAKNTFATISDKANVSGRYGRHEQRLVRKVDRAATGPRANGRSDEVANGRDLRPRGWDITYSGDGVRDGDCGGTDFFNQDLGSGRPYPSCRT